MSYIYKGIGDSISQNRSKRNISQEELAEKLKVARATLANWEKNRREPSIEMVIKMCLFLEMSADVLLGIPTKENKQEIVLLELFNSLNEEGQEKLLEQAEFFVSSGKYIKNNKSEMVQAE